MGLVTRAVRILKEDGVVALGKKSSGKAANRIKYHAYGLGSGRECPLCGFIGAKFWSAGNPPRPEARCPNCGAAERHRLLWLYVENKTNILDRSGPVVYFAPVDIIARRLAGYRHVVTVDLRMGSVNVNADITALPFSESAFDTVLCSHVLEHVPDDRSAMEEMHRILQPDGEALIMIPKDNTREQTYEDSAIKSPTARKEAFGQENHVRWYGRDIADRLSEAGFEISVETPAQEFNNATVNKYGLRVHDRILDRTRFEDIHHCRK